MRAQQKIASGLLAIFLLALPAAVPAQGVPVAVFPLQELGSGRHDANLPLTRLLEKRLAEDGNEIIGLDTVITFMANNRIRTVGHLETLDVARARSDLGAAFVLLGTVSQRKERPEPSLGLTLNLVRTRDARTVWSYIGSLSVGEERRIMGIEEPESVDDLQALLLNEITSQWPRETIAQVRQEGTLNIETVSLKPQYARPGDEVHARVRLREAQIGGVAPRVFFKVGDQLYPANHSEENGSYEATWVAGEENGRYPVNLLFEWPQYARVQTALLGNYIVDGTPPVFEMEFQGVKYIDNMPVFSNRLTILPRMVVRKPLSRWRLAFYLGENNLIGEMEGEGNFPWSFIWTGRGNEGDGVYEVVIEAWDQAGNIARASKEVELNRSLPKVDLAVERDEKEMVVDLNYDGKVPLKYWRLEMWTNEGKILAQEQGEELPVKIGVDLPELGAEQGTIKGYLTYQDALGKEVRRNVEDLLPKLVKEKEEKEEEEGLSKSWVDSF